MTVAGLLFASAAALRAHGADATGARPWWSEWDLEPGAVIGLLVAGALYASGLRWLRAATGSSRKLRGAAWCYFAGWIVLAIALVSPLHPWGARLFTAHMTQHELLMVAAAPLLVLGRPALVFLWAFPRGAARGIVAALRAAGGEQLWSWALNPFAAFLIHAFVLWIWHAPRLFEAANRNDVVHTVQHTTFLLSALLFWHAVLFGRCRSEGYGLAVLYLFLTTIHSGVLGALITFARSVWYPSYAAAGIPGLTPLEDQQLGGLIMWVPAALVYIGAALGLFARWISDSDARQSASASRGPPPPRVARARQP